MRRAALAAAVGLLILPATAAAKRVSPAYWLYQHSHAHRGDLVGVRCTQAGGETICLLVIQPQPKTRSCWLVGLLPAQPWRVDAVAAQPRARCPILHEERHQPRWLKQ